MLFISNGVTPRVHSSAVISQTAVIAGDVTIDANCWIGHGAIVGRDSQVRINGIVHIRTVLPPGSMVPIGWVAVGNSAIIRPTSAHDEIWAVQQTLEFPAYVFGAKRTATGGSPVTEMMAKYAKALRKYHADDQPVP